MMRESGIAAMLFVLVSTTQCGRVPAQAAPSPAPHDVVTTTAPAPPPPSATTAATTPATPSPCGLDAPRAPRARTATRPRIPGPAPAQSFAPSADHSRIVATRADGAAYVVGWRKPFGPRRLVGTPLPRTEGDVAESFVIASDGQRVVGTSTTRGPHGWQVHHTERVWNATTGTLRSSRSVVLSGQYTASTPTLDRRAILGSGYFGDAGYELHLAGVPTHAAQRIVAGKTLFHDAAWSEDGQWLATTRALRGDELTNAIGRQHPATFVMWRVDPPTKLFERELDHQHIAGFIGEGTFVVVTHDRQMRVLETATGREVAALDIEGHLLRSTRSDIVVIETLGDHAREVLVFDRASGTRQRIVHLGDGDHVALDPSGKQLAITGENRLCVLDVDSGHIAASLTFEGQTGGVWSADSRDVSAWGVDGSLVTAHLADESVEVLSVDFGALE